MNITFEQRLLSNRPHQDQHETFDLFRKLGLEHYEKLLLGKYYSQYDGKKEIIDTKSTANISLHIIECDIIYKLEEKEEEVLKKSLKEGIPEKSTHILIVDRFFKARRIYVTRKGASKGYRDLMKDIYINKIGRPDYSSELPGYDMLSGIGMINYFYDYLCCDSLGYRLIDNEHGLLQSIDGTKNIVILGGSFSQSIFSVPGYTFVDHLNNIVDSNYGKQRVRFFNFSQRGSIQSDNFCQLVQLGIIDKVDCVIWIDGLNDCSSSSPLSSLNLGYGDLAISGKSMERIPLLRKEYRTQQELAKYRLLTYLQYRKRVNKLHAKLGINSINICQPICDYLSQDIPSFTKSLVKYGIKAYEVNYGYTNWCKNIQNYAQSMFDLEYLGFDAQEMRNVEYADFCHLTPTGERDFANLLMKKIESKLAEYV